MTKEILRKVWDSLSWECLEDSRVIEERCDFKPERTCESVRSACRELVRLGFPVVTGREGVGRTVSPQLLAANVRDLRNRAKAISERADDLLARISEGWSTAAYNEKAEKYLS